MSTVAVFDTLTEAELAQGLLQSAGIEAVLDDHDLFHGVSDALPAEGAVSIVAPEDQVEDAKLILADAQASGGTTAQDVADAAAGSQEIS